MIRLCIVCRIGVEKGRKLFKSLLMRCSKNKKEWTDAQARVEDLKQQLEEAEGQVVRKKDQFDKSRKQVRQCKGHQWHQIRRENFLFSFGDCCSY